MFEQQIKYPQAVTDGSDSGLAAGWTWCLSHLQEGERLTVWTHQKNNLGNNEWLHKTVTGNSKVDHVTARGVGNLMRYRGPALLAWADSNDTAEFIRFNGKKITAMCVAAWNVEELVAWVGEAGPEILGDETLWDGLTVELDPVVQAAMKDLTSIINHNNTITAGFEKDQVVSTLLTLHDAGYIFEGGALAGWATAHGWVGKNPERLQKYAETINNGKRPRARNVLRTDYISWLLGKTK